MILRTAELQKVLKTNVHHSGIESLRMRRTSLACRADYVIGSFFFVPYSSKGRCYALAQDSSVSLLVGAVGSVLQASCDLIVVEVWRSAARRGSLIRVLNQDLAVIGERQENS